MRGIITTTNEGYTIIEAAYIDTNHGYVIGKSKNNYVAKYRVQLGAFVTKLRQRSIIVQARDAETAVKRAEDRFRYECNNAVIFTEVDSIEVDSVEEIG